MKIDNKVVLITGANRGVGRALVLEALRRNAKKVYAATRRPEQLNGLDDSRVIPLRLDITQASDVQMAAARAKDVQILINNAGSLASASVLQDDIAAIEIDVNVNFFGTLRVTRAFAPIISANGGGVIASVSSILGLASSAQVGGYSASKAALASAIQAIRSELKPHKIEVCGVYPGPIDTGMSKLFATAKASTEEVAMNIFRGIETGEEDIFPDPVSAHVGRLWLTNPKALERQFAST